MLDEAHQFLSGPDAMQLIDPDVAGYIFVTYRVSRWIAGVFRDPELAAELLAAAATPAPA